MISSVLYKDITDLLDYIQVRGSKIINNINQMNVDLNNSEIDADNIHRQLLASTVASTYNSLFKWHESPPKGIRNFVGALQDHVNDNYGDVNNYLTDNSTQVRPTFAWLSDLMGYPIDAENIENIS